MELQSLHGYSWTLEHLLFIFTNRSEQNTSLESITELLNEAEDLVTISGRIETMAAFNPF
jgi:hypothetical protein